ncbi:Fungal Zn(2)-Cys(6) binuclear cluster domain [Geosmithia morbida]|uniref:Fungal Zn(2)-Cys(6) binuclear cluster domain n=1 Tax=Geosmithia morbida TaxID=1094350 RepID=A0A9P5D557_9HYPO|nr:Fungal Zn(2)-Cys(6) binuclear cluster domain [Geosmithia morbida]KAF4122164.1 Fungal Zn(2)-Cys(6) binuclear cluster domain [Geosmithia morbida]
MSAMCTGRPAMWRLPTTRHDDWDSPPVTSAKPGLYTSVSPLASLAGSSVPSPATLSRSPFLSQSVALRLQGQRIWPETDRHSLIIRLSELCDEILETENSASGAGQTDEGLVSSQHLSAETVQLVSNLCVFIQAWSHGRSVPGETAADTSAEAAPPSDSVDMVHRRLVALANLNQAIETANPFAFLGIAAFAVFEVCDTASFGDWPCHVHGARGLLDRHGCRTSDDILRLSASVPGLLGILARLVWYDISSCVLRNSRSTGNTKRHTKDEERCNLIFDDWHIEAVIDNDLLHIIGCPARAMDMYVDASKADSRDRQLTRNCLRAMEQLLQVKTEVGPRGSAHASTEDSMPSIWGDLHRCGAALAVLGRVAADEDVPAADLAATIAAVEDKLCELLAAAPHSSRFYIHMAVPAYLAGMHASTPNHCHVVRQYWLNCRRAGISRYSGGLLRCEEHWRQIGLLGAGQDKNRYA